MRIDDILQTWITICVAGRRGQIPVYVMYTVWYITFMEIQVVAITVLKLLSNNHVLK